MLEIVIMMLIIVVVTVMMVSLFVSTISKFHQQRFFPTFVRLTIEVLNDLFAFVSGLHSVKGE